MTNDSGNTLLALLTGAAIGAGIGILYAPDKGTKTRKKIKKRAMETTDGILKLQREIYREQLRLHVNRTKAKFYPTNLLGGVGGIAQKLIISFVAKRILKRFS
ncbi:MAG: YtxH domain-containing protein [Flavobacteriaceae bacterium]